MKNKAKNDRIVPVFNQGVTMWQKCDARVRVRERVYSLSCIYMF